MTDSDAYTLHPIGFVHSELVDRAEAPRQGDEGAPDATIEVTPHLLAGLGGIEAGQELIIVTWLHHASRDVLEVHPRDDLTRPLAGVFGTRSSDRPNPLGLHRVTVRAVQGAGSAWARSRRSTARRSSTSSRPCARRASAELGAPRSRAGP
jgi:tRNA-Thr(GGU) m(6)t(6)A37 methyltransferase TsaA